MTRFTFRPVGLAAALCATVGIATAANPNSKPVPAAKPTFDSKPLRKPPVIIAPPSGEVLAEAVKAEMDAYVRRLDVCTRLRQIAVETGDDSLQATADDLEKQAGNLYQQRVAKLGLNPSAPPRNTDTLLDRKLGTGTAVDPLTVAPPQPLDKSATAGRASR